MPPSDVPGFRKPRIRLPAHDTDPESPSTGLAYRFIAPTRASYVIADTTEMTVVASTGNIRVETGLVAEALVELAAVGGNLRATVRLPALDGTARTSAGSSFRAGSEQISGPAEVMLTPRGEATIVAEPTMSRDTKRVIGSSDFFTMFFVRLPGRDVERGATWTDTISTSWQGRESQLRTLRIVTSSWARDTTLDGWVLNVIESTSTIHTEWNGGLDGREVRQELTGRSMATVLWNPVRRLVHELRESAATSGSTVLPGSDQLDMRTGARARRVLRLKK